ncbi:MAG: DUF1800 domain-containing protein [Acidobacteriota bacterium]|nr:DUF1800 domain-containing protein [Acidobacteriota bacterium]
MDSRNSRFLQCALSVFLLIFPLVFSALAQEDSDPNSPTPVILSMNNSTRALASELNSARRDKRLSKEKALAFSPGSKIVIYVTNVELMPDEGANAFRLDVQDRVGRKYRFPVEEITPVRGQEWIYAVTVELRDEIGFWEQPKADGDVLIRLTWRGLSSNQVKLGLGSIGGDIKDEEGTVPTPLKNFSTAPAETASALPSVGYRWSGDRMRFLEQATFGPTAALDSRIRRLGLRTWLAEQFDAPYPGANNPYPNIPLKSSNAQDITYGCGPNNAQNPTYGVCIRDHYSQYPLQNWFFKEAFYGDAQLRHRVAWALSQIWVTSGVDVQQSSHMIEYHKVLSKHAFGNYRNLMKDMTLNPAMGDYLDMARSTRTSPNENYPREILQLFTIGLFMLNQDGTVQVDSNNIPLPSYDQATVNNFTKVLTGWGFCNNNTNPACPNVSVGTVNFKDPLLLNQNNHDVTAKTLLNYPNPRNTNIAANLAGATELDLALDNIFYHPNVAPFVSKLLIQHLVTSNPTPAYVGRVSAVFNNNGSGVRGDMKAVVRAILLDAEARGDNKTDPNYGKLREPVQLLTNLFRTFNVRSADGTQQSDGVVAGLPNGMAQNPFYAPTVFNYYTPDYVIPGTALPGPEFNIMTTGTAISRANFANTMVFSRINTGTNAPLGTSIDLTEMQALAAADTTSNQLLDALNQKMLHGTMSAGMRSTIMTAVQAVPSTTPLARAQQAIYLIATSSQYQTQR